MQNNIKPQYLINTRYEFSKLTSTNIIDPESAQEFKKKFMQNNERYVVSKGEKSLIDLNRLIQDDKVAPEVITNFNKQVLHQSNFTDGIIVNEKFVNVLGKHIECIKNVNEFIRSDKLIYPNGKEKALELIFVDHSNGDPCDNVYMDFCCIKNATEIHETGCDFILLVDEIYYADNSIDDICVLFDAKIPTSNIKQLLSSLGKFKAGAFRNVSVDNNKVTFNISKAYEKKSWWMRKIPRWSPKFLKSFAIWTFGLNKESIVINDHELLDMLKERIERDNKNNETKETNVNKHGLFVTTRENGILKERFVSYETDQKVANTPKLRKPSEKEEQIKK